MVPGGNEIVKPGDDSGERTEADASYTSPVKPLLQVRHPFATSSPVSAGWKPIAPVGPRTLAFVARSSAPRAGNRCIVKGPKVAGGEASPTDPSKTIAANDGGFVVVEAVGAT